MGLIAFLKRLFLGTPAPSSDGELHSSADSHMAESERPSPGGVPASSPQTPAPRTQFRIPDPLRYATTVRRRGHTLRVVRTLPYRFARPHLALPGKYNDLAGDHHAAWLAKYGLPELQTPEELARWLEVPLGRLAWLTGRFFENERPQSEQVAHYHFHWVKKKTAGYRLIEAPKDLLKTVQTQILRGILDQVSAHPASHGFVKQRSIRSNAAPHVGSAWVLKLDLKNFYPSVSFSRVVAIFRSLGYCREVAIWLGRLTTSAIPSNLNSPDGLANTVWPYRSRHLPQGAPTSPALANLSAFSLDVRLNGMAAKYGARYTRYADDLTLSGPGQSIPALREIIPFAEWIVRNERFTTNKAKRRVLRRHQRQTVTGIVVNEKLTLSRAEFDQLKAILTNCLRHGTVSQNREGHADFAAHLRGRIGHFLSVNPERGEKLRLLFQQIDWGR
jgi:RNA-directed DNA polymerase